MLDRCGHEEEGLSSLNFQAKLTLSHWEGKLSVSLISSHFKLKRLNTWWVWMTGQGLPSSAAAAKSLQSCPTLCDPIDSSSPGSTVPGILQARTLEWIAMSFSSAWKWKVKVKSLSRVRLLATPWTAAHQAPPSMGSSMQEYWSGVPWENEVRVSLMCLFLNSIN